MFIAILCLNGVEQPFETPVSLLSALETKEPAPSARVLPCQGWAPDPAPPGSAPDMPYSPTIYLLTIADVRAVESRPHGLLFTREAININTE